MNVQGLSEFSVVAKPVEPTSSDSVLYDVFSSFVEDGTVHNYFLVNGIGFSSSSPSYSAQIPTIKCLDSEHDQLPPINSFVSAINKAIAVPSSAIECPNGNLFHVAVNNIDFALCKLDSLGFAMQSSDMDVKVEYLNTYKDSTIPIPDSTLNCGTMAVPSSITPIGRSLLTGGSIPQSNVRSLKAAFKLPFQKSRSSCLCKSARRPCIFVHGLGIKEEMPTNQDNFTHYWGDHLFKHAPCCSSLKFTHLNTVENMWTSPKLQQKVCDRVLAVSDSSTNIAIVDTIVVTHSMGNLMFAGALANGICKLGPSSTWVGLAAPMMGSMCSDFTQKSCAGNTNAFWEKIGDITGRCPPTTALKSLAYQGEKYSYKSLDAMYVAAQETYTKNVYAAMCGKSNSGIVSKYQVKFWALGRLVPHKSPDNDGMVEFQSCAAGIPRSNFGNSWKDRFYVTHLNHFDMEFLSGDSVFNEKKMPVKWFECLL
ncbi:unnamed protein product [Peronospora belbahrii]|uniref:Uncharacterized protein n=1 Tax=Peronospora belbahrii TaxID=622444 RepID=A0ABN8D161_9STRA|nr:unnamed protein product [Peronospora belbahrii]